MSKSADVGSSRGRILVADDEPHIRRILTTFLEAASFDVHPVSDGQSAVDALSGDSHYDLVLLDLMMPDMTGLDVLSRSREMDHRRDVPVMILTAKGQDTDRREAFARGASDFVIKPFSPKKLLSRIDELLEST